MTEQDDPKPFLRSPRRRQAEGDEGRPPFLIRPSRRATRKHPVAWGWMMAAAAVALLAWLLTAWCGKPSAAAMTSSDAAPRWTQGARSPIAPWAPNADSLIRDQESHIAHLWQLTFGGENAEGYWSKSGRRLIFQSTRDGWPCDQMYVMDLRTGRLTRVSTGRGRTTCGYFYDDDHRVLFSSTHAGGDSCPPLPDFSQGYVWPVYASYDIWTARPDGGDLRRLTNAPGYDAEGTVSVDQQWIVFTSDRDGDLDLYKMRTDGSELKRLTNTVGYDGGAFFSRDGKWICYRASHPADSAAIEYRALLERNLVRPGKLDLWVMRADGSDPRQVTDMPGASFAPYFTPDGKSLIYSSNWEQPRGRNFDLYLVPVAGGTPVPVTRDASFDGFPMFSPDGRWLVFASNRGQRQRGETNLFLAEWRR
jgi:Tol biopolymer transport system component